MGRHNVHYSKAFLFFFFFSFFFKKKNLNFKVGDCISWRFKFLNTPPN